MVYWMQIHFSINKFFGIKTYSRVIFNTFVILEFAIPLFRMLSNVVQGISIFSENFFMLPYLSMMRVFTFASSSFLCLIYLVFLVRS